MRSRGPGQPPESLRPQCPRETLITLSYRRGDLRCPRDITSFQEPLSQLQALGQDPLTSSRQAEGGAPWPLPGCGPVFPRCCPPELETGGAWPRLGQPAKGTKGVVPAAPTPTCVPTHGGEAPGAEAQPAGSGGARGEAALPASSGTHTPL